MACKRCPAGTTTLLLGTKSGEGRSCFESLGKSLMRLSRSQTETRLWRCGWQRPPPTNSPEPTSLAVLFGPITYICQASTNDQSSPSLLDEVPQLLTHHTQSMTGEGFCRALFRRAAMAHGLSSQVADVQEAYLGGLSPLILGRSEVAALSLMV